MDAPKPLSAVEPASPTREAQEGGIMSENGSYGRRDRVNDLVFLAVSAAGFAFVVYDRWGGGLLG